MALDNRRARQSTTSVIRTQEPPGREPGANQDVIYRQTSGWTYAGFAVQGAVPAVTISISVIVVANAGDVVRARALRLSGAGASTLVAGASALNLSRSNDA